MGVMVQVFEVVGIRLFRSFCRLFRSWFGSLFDSVFRRLVLSLRRGDCAKGEGSRLGTVARESLIGRAAGAKFFKF